MRKAGESMTELAPHIFPAGITSGSPERDEELYVDFVAKYWGDPAYREWVDRDPAGALRAEGLRVPHGVEVNLLPASDNDMHVVLPACSEV